MATTQPWATGGSLLAGIGGANTNGPQSSDVNATLGLIRQNNEFSRAGGNNVGLQALQGLQGLSDAYKQDQLQKSQAAFNQAHANAWKSGDTSALRDFAVQNPAFVTQAQQAVSHLGEAQRSDIGNLAAGMRVSLAQGPEAFSKFVTSNSGTLGRVGADPNTILQMGISNPQAAQQFVDTLGMSSLGGKDYFDAIDKRQGRALEQSQQQVTMRGQDLTAETARRGQDISASNARLAASTGMTGNNIAAARLALDQNKFAFDIQQAQEKADQLKNGAPKITDATSKMIDGSINDATASRNSADSMSALAQQFRQEKPTTGLFGNASNMFAKVTGTDTALRDLRIRQNALVNNQVLRFLPPGPATDRDVEIVRQGAPTDMDNPEVVARWLDAMSNLERKSAQFNEFKAEWVSANGNPGQARNGGNILGMDIQKGESLGQAAKRYMSQQQIGQAPTPEAQQPTQQPQQPQQQQGGFSSLWGD